MKELWDLFKDAGFSRATQAQAGLAAIAFTVFATLATGLDIASALPMLVGAYVLAAPLIAGTKAIHAWRDRMIARGREDEE